MENTLFKDINGNYVIIPFENLIEGFKGTLFGLSFPVILALRKKFVTGGGKPFGATKEDVEFVFKPKCTCNKGEENENQCNKNCKI